MSTIRSSLIVAIVVIVAIFCLPTAGDTAIATDTALPASTRQNAVSGQRLVVLEETPAPGTPVVADFRATDLAASFVGMSKNAANVHPEYVTLTVRDEKGEIAWDISSRQVWLVTFPNVGYPSASGSSDCSCQMNYWRPSTIVAVDADTVSRLSS